MCRLTLCTSVPSATVSHSGRGQFKCDGTRAETRFRLSAKRTNPFKSAEASDQSTAGSRGVRVSGSNAGYTMFRGSVKSTGYPLHLPVFFSVPLPCGRIVRTWLCQMHRLYDRKLTSPTNCGYRYWDFAEGKGDWILTYPLSSIWSVVGRDKV